MSHPAQQEIRLRSSARTNQGRVRKNNEDSIHLWGEDSFILAVVADGMGGAAAGEEASRIAVETVHNIMAEEGHRKITSYGDEDDEEVVAKLRESIEQANINIVMKAKNYPEFKGMGTTVTLAFARSTDVLLAHVGDSRAYLIDGDTKHIDQITSDHSFVQALVDAGHITAEEAEHHPMKNVLYRALGQADDIEVDIVRDVRMHVGDRMVLCSDGLTLHVKPSEIAEIASEESDPNIASERLINLANERGGRDNISVIVILVESASEKSTQVTEEAIATPAFDDEATVPLKRTDLPPNPLMSNKPQSLNRPAYAGKGDSYGEGWDSREPRQ